MTEQAPRADAAGLDASEWMKLGAKAAFAGVTNPEEAISWLAQQLQPEVSELTEEDSEPAAPKSNIARAAELAADVLTRPLTDTQAIELAKVYALMAIHERMPSTEGLIAALTVHQPGTPRPKTSRTTQSTKAGS